MVFTMNTLLVEIFVGRNDRGYEFLRFPRAKNNFRGYNFLQVAGLTLLRSTNICERLFTHSKV